MSQMIWGQMPVVVEAEPPSDPLDTPVYRSATHPDELVENLSDESIGNCWDIFQMALKSSRHKQYLGTREKRSDPSKETGEACAFGEYIWITYGEAEAMVLSVGKWLEARGYVPSQEFPQETLAEAQRLRFLGLYCKNCYQWLICEQTANAFGFTLVPLYDSLGADSIVYILALTRLTTVVTCQLGLRKIIKAKGRADVFVETAIIVDDSVSADLVVDATLENINVILWEDMLLSAQEEYKASDENGNPNVTAGPDGKDEVCVTANRATVQTICFTSGTTGQPKGVIMTHGNICAAVCAAARCHYLDPDLAFQEDDTHLSYLPLAHTFERILCNLACFVGARIGFYTGSTVRLMDDIKALNPTVFVSVPRLFDRIDQKIEATLRRKSSAQRKLFNFAMEQKLANLRRNGTLRHVIWDKLIFRRAQSLLGCKLRYMIVGGAPMDPDLQDRMKVLLSCSLTEGYGMTETLGATFCSLPKYPSGSVGFPLPCVEFKLRSIPEMNYSVHDELPRGELLMRGPAVTKGYFLSPKETQNALTPDGWLYSGDVAVMMPNGLLRIIDRKKSIFKLSQGEYVAPEVVEGVYCQAPLVSHIFVFGYSTKPMLVGIVVPELEAAREWGEDWDIPADTTLEEYCRNKKFEFAVAHEMEIAGRLLKGFEKVHKVKLSSTEFSCENGMLTPTFKIRRHVVYNTFKQEIDMMYNELESVDRRTGGG